MNRIKFDLTTIKYIPIFENVTRSHLKDCIIGESSILFIVQEGEASKAIGKNGQNAKTLERMMKKKIKIVEFSPEVKKFVSNLIYPLKVPEIEEKEDGLLLLKGADVSIKSMLIGRNASNLRNTESIAKRYFEIKEIKVV